MARLTGWRYSLLISIVCGGSIAALYPIAIQPMIDPSKYKQIQKETRKNIIQENIQPGDMKVWTDPFDRKK